MRSEKDRIPIEYKIDPLDKVNCPAGPRNVLIRMIERKAKQDRSGDGFVEGIKNWHSCQFTKNTYLFSEIKEVNISKFPNRPGFWVIGLDANNSVRILGSFHKTDQAMKFCKIMYFSFVNIDPWPKW